MDDFAGPPPEPREDRGPRIPPAKLSTIKSDPTISLFYKPDKNAPVTLVDDKFPRDAAMIFCDRIRHDLMDNNSKSFTIVGGNLDGHKEVIGWIKQCVDGQSIVKFRDLDETNLGFFITYANIILTSYYLGIPARDLSDHLLKRMTAIARKQLMTWNEVEWFYQTPVISSLPEDKENALREVAATSVFWAWWNGKLDSEETPEEMMILSVLRQENEKLDQDLHDWCDKNEKEVRRKWEEKDNAKKYGGRANDDNGFSKGDGAGWDEAAPATSEGATGGCDEPATVTSGGASTWDTADAFSEDPLAPPNSLASPEFGGNHGTQNTSFSPLNEIDLNTNGFSGNGGGDWAEEVNEEVVDQGHRYNNDQW